eukprot:SAG22_NODE_498_length_9728_cov_12.354346_3_plen_658_part_00
MLTKLFVGMLADFFASSSGNLLLTAEQRNWQFMHLFIYHVIKIRKVPLNPLRRKCFYLVNSQLFRRGIDVVVLLNVGQLIAATAFPDVDNVLKLLLAGQWFVIAIYGLEAVAKSLAFGLREYVKDSKLELCILAAMVLSTLELLLREIYGVSSGGAWISQALQSTRVLRLASVMGAHSSRMRKMYYTVSVSLPQVMNLVMAMGVIFNVFSVFAQALCGRPAGATEAGGDGDLNSFDNFDSTLSSMRVLFQIATGQSFGTMITECQAYTAFPLLVTPFFFSFFVVGNFIFISLFVALLLDNLDLIASDDFAVSDVDIELWRESWLSTGLRLDQPMNISKVSCKALPFCCAPTGILSKTVPFLAVSKVRGFVQSARGAFAFIHKADPYWYNRLLLELQLPPDAEILAEEEIEFFKLLRAVCHIRFSSKCLSLDDEVQKSTWLQDHLHRHAARVIEVGVRGWLQQRKPVPASGKTACGRAVRSKRQWHAAIHCAKVLQLSAVISTQRITPEHVVSENLDRLQRLVDRRKDREEVKALAKTNRKAASDGAAKAARLAELKAERAAAKKKGRGQRRRDAREKKSEMAHSMIWSSNSEHAAAATSSGDAKKDEEVNKEALLETMAWKERNAFLTRKTTHAVLNNENPEEDAGPGPGPEPEPEQ